MDLKCALYLFIKICVYILGATVSAVGTRVRLVNGGSNFGTVQVYYNRTWGTICDHSFDNKEAAVICKMLKFNGNARSYPWAHFGSGSGPIMMDKLRCTGQESNIAYCPFNGWYKHSCTHSQDAGVDCEATDVRLVHGGADYGTVEINYYGTWGTICDDNFDENEAAVICRMLGKSGRIVAYSRAHFGQGTGSILMDDVMCTGQEKSIGHCAFNGWSNHDCTHFEDAGVDCNDLQNKSKPATECYDTKMCPCCNTGCPSDDSGHCGGDCKDGYHGDSCWNKCPTNCARCVDAKGRFNVANCTQCKEGYYWTPTYSQCQQSCQIGCKICDHPAAPLQCTVCKDTHFLSQSYQCIKCNESCLTCNSTTFCTSCRQGDYLTESKQCQKCRDECKTCKILALCTSCKSGYFLEGDDKNCYKCGPLCKSCTSYDRCICTNGCSEDRCIDSSGLCSYGCKPNFIYYNNTNKCDRCKDFRYGYACDLGCSSSCTESTCDRVSGACKTCRSGYYGDHCDMKCPEYCTSSCNKTTGNCDTCREGYYGASCTRRCPTSCRECIIDDGSCSKCVDGFYGVSCDMNCSVHCLIDRCERTDGSCVCEHGFGGERCQFEITTPSSTDKSQLVITPEPVNYVGTTVGITTGCVVLIAVGAAAVIWLYRRRRRNSAGGTNQSSIFSVSHRTTHSGNVVEQKCINPYLNTGRADLDTSDNSYEMLQRQPQEVPPYTPMKF